jgi:cardiolipin synthase A/B
MDNLWKKAISIAQTHTDVVASSPEYQSPEYRLYHHSKECIDGIIELLERATTQIDIEAFYLLPDSVGRSVLELLTRKALAGVRVRLLVDSMGSFSMSQSLFIEALQKAGAHIRFFNSLVPFSKSNKSFWYFRNHRRSIIVDETELFVGSFCIGELTMEWRETCILIKNSMAVAQASKTFKETWRKTSHPTFKIGSSSKSSTDCFSYITQAPLQRQRYIYTSLINDIRTAQKSIILIAPYIIPDRALLRAIRGARRRNVSVTIITSAKTDSTLADLGRNTYISRLLHMGVVIYFVDHMVHSKVMIFDNVKAYIGTLNLDSVSLRYNYESTIITDSLHCVHDLTDSFSDILSQYDLQLNLDTWHKRPAFTKIAEALVWPFRSFL